MSPQELFLFFEPYLPILAAALAYTLSFGAVTYFAKIRRERSSK